MIRSIVEALLIPISGRRTNMEAQVAARLGDNRQLALEIVRLAGPLV
jgi:hypothetical protein